MDEEHSRAILPKVAKAIFFYAGGVFKHLVNRPHDLRQDSSDLDRCCDCDMW
jgi:hypothetical protein